VPAPEPPGAAGSPEPPAAGSAPPRPELVWLAALVAAAAALRFVAIGHQSFWLDESFTVDLVKRPFGDLVSGIASTESTPPLYYVLAWLWAKLFGTHEAGLRSLSALFGTIAVPVVWRTAREWFGSARAGLIAAALVAFNPFFVWYSQEARSYSLLVLMAALSLLWFGRVLRDRTGRAFAGWAVVAALALLTHYFAAFLLVPEAIWMLWVTRERAAWMAAGVLAAVGAALAPLAIHQRDLGHTAFIADLGLGRRLADLPKKLVTGELGTPTPLIGPLAGLIAVAAIAWALARGAGGAGGAEGPARTEPAGAAGPGDGPAAPATAAAAAPAGRGRVVLLLGLVAAAGAVPLVLALAGSDYLLPRNVIALYVPLVLAVAAGLGNAGRLGTAGAIAICAVALIVNIEVTSDAKLQRDDWRGAARALGPTTAGPRAVIVSPDYAKRPLRLYAGSLPPLPPGTAVTEVDLIVNARPPSPPPAAPPPFRQASTKQTPSYVLTRYVSSAPAPVDPNAFPTPKPSAALIQQTKGTTP
jgi:4-amino-4-deoxy-L-arabinose transferase-like glycosyltransferase